MILIMLTICCGVMIISSLCFMGLSGKSSVIILNSLNILVCMAVWIVAIVWFKKNKHNLFQMTNNKEFNGDDNSSVPGPSFSPSIAEIDKY